GRSESARAIQDLGHADKVFGGVLAAEQRDAGHSDLCCELLHERRLADARRAPNEDRARERDVEEEVAELFLRDGDGRVHAGARTPMREMHAKLRCAVYPTRAEGGG